MACQGAIRYEAGELIKKTGHGKHRSLERKIDRVKVLLENLENLKRTASVMNGVLGKVTPIAIRWTTYEDQMDRIILSRKTQELHRFLYFPSYIAI